ncbi:DUF397 domain-containing protein [Streptomyces olivoreticuli]
MGEHRPPADALRRATFHKSSYSGPNNECVEVAHIPDWACVRDSKTPGPVIALPVAAFSTFVRTITSAPSGAL